MSNQTLTLLEERESSRIAAFLLPHADRIVAGATDDKPLPVVEIDDFHRIHNFRVTCEKSRNSIGSVVVRVPESNIDAGSKGQ
jgi:hypothetical protein